MNTMIQDLHIFKSLAAIGIEPEAARRVERAIESAIVHGQNELRTEFREQQAGLMTKQNVLELKAELKSDIAELKAELKADIHAMGDDLRKAMNEQTWRLVTFVVAANGLMLAAFKLIG
jgi:hydrogenase maturation factor